jgi:DHA1 family tetracycline resistance protein-like MFS transporter
MKKLIPAFLLTLVNVLGFSILIPVLPFIVEDFGGNAFTYGLLISAYSVFQFFGSPVLGTLSDMYGRRPILLISQAGTLLAWIIFGIAYFVPQKISLLGFALPLVIIFVSRVLDGLTGGNISTTNAYVSDLTTKAEKSQKFGLIGAIFGVGMIIGPALGGLSASTSYGWIGTIILSVTISLITLIAIWWYLPESLAAKNRQPIKKIRLREQLNIFAKIKAFSGNQIVSKMLFVRFLFGSIMAGYTSVIVLYLIDLFGFNPTEIGWFLLFVGSFLIFNQGLLVNIFVKKFGETKTLLLGQLSMAFGIVAMTFTSELWLFIILYYFLNLGLSLSMPTIQALLVNNVADDRQGEISGLDQSIGAFCAAYAPALTGLGYLYWGEKVFWIFAVFALVSAVLLGRMKRFKKNRT